MVSQRVRELDSRAGPSEHHRRLAAAGVWLGWGCSPVLFPKGCFCPLRPSQILWRLPASYNPSTLPGFPETGELEIPFPGCLHPPPPAGIFQLMAIISSLCVCVFGFIFLEQVQVHSAVERKVERFPVLWGALPTGPPLALATRDENKSSKT